MFRLVDRNYPAAASGRPVIRLGEVTVTRAVKALLSVMPLDSFVDKPLERMEVDENPRITTPMQVRDGRMGNYKCLQYIYILITRKSRERSLCPMTYGYLIALGSVILFFPLILDILCKEHLLHGYA